MEVVMSHRGEPLNSNERMLVDHNHVDSATRTFFIRLLFQTNSKLDKPRDATMFKNEYLLCSPVPI